MPDDAPLSPARPLMQASERLRAALDRLEQRLQHVASTQAAPARQLQLFEQENEALRQEKDRLNAAIAQLHDQYNDLRAVASTIYGKLEESIETLTGVMEG